MKNISKLSMFFLKETEMLAFFFLVVFPFISVPHEAEGDHSSISKFALQYNSFRIMSYAMVYAFAYKKTCLRTMRFYDIS